MPFRLLFAILAAWWCMDADARLVHVSPTGSPAGPGTASAPYDSLKRALIEAGDGDTVLLEEGRYREHNLHLYGKNLVIGSRYLLDGDTGHVARTIVDGDSTLSDSGSIFSLIHPATRPAEFHGFTLTRGTGTHWTANVIDPDPAGGAFYVDKGPAVKAVRMKITGNGSQFGHTLHTGYHSPGVSEFVDCEFSRNLSYWGAFHMTDTRLLRCRFTRNIGVTVAREGSVDMRHCVISGNQGKTVSDASVRMVSCALYNPEPRDPMQPNEFFEYGDGNNFDLTIVNSVILDPMGYFPNARDIVIAGSVLHRSFGDRFPGSTGNKYWSGENVFKNPGGDDLRLAPNSIAVDAGHRDSAYSLEPACGGGNAGIDAGAYGNTAEATCRSNGAHMVFSPQSFARTLFRGEVRFDSFAVANSHPDPMYLRGAADIAANDPGMRILGTSRTATSLGSGESCQVRFRYSPAASGAVRIPILVNFDADNAGAGVDYAADVSPFDYDSLFSNHWDFKYARAGATKSESFRLENRGRNTIRIDSLRERSIHFELTGAAGGFELGPGESRAVEVSFSPPATQPYQARLYLYSPNIDAVDSTLILSGQGVDSKDPVARIDSAAPNPVAWGQALNVFGSARDADAIGEDPPIREYAWSLENGRTWNTANLVAVSSALFRIGPNVLTFRVRDNEGDWSDADSRVIEVTGLEPFARIDSVTPSGIILRGPGRIALHARAHDLDEGAGEEADSLRSARWMSTLQGQIASGKRASAAAADLRLGLHGFYLEVVDDEGDTSRSDTAWVPVQNGIGRALIVAGTAFDDYAYFFSNIAPNANWAYRQLRERGFSDEQIHYLNPVGWQSLQDPYQDSRIVDRTDLSLAALRDYLASPDVRRDVRNQVPLVLYLVGHGSSNLQDGKFYLNPTEYLVADSLARWLDGYGDLEEGNAHMLLVLDFCRSGSFLNRLRTAQTQNRLVIASSDAENSAYFKDGKAFSWTIWHAVREGRDMRRAFEEAREWSLLSAPGIARANPLLNADNDGKFSEAEDLDWAGRVHVGGNQRFQGLETVLDSLWQETAEAGIRIKARMRGQPGRLWFRVFPPGFDPGQGRVEELEAVPMTPENDSIHSGIARRFPVLGEYLIQVDGTDGEGRSLMGGHLVVRPASIGVRPGAGDAGDRPRILSPAWNGRDGLLLRVPRDGFLRVDAYDGRGRHVRTLADGYLKAGQYRVGGGEAILPHGLGFVTIRSGGQAWTLCLVMEAR